MQLSLKQAESLKEHLSSIPDPRFRRGIRHRKLSVLTTALCAIICSATSFIAIAEWAKAGTQSMLKRLGCRLNPKTRRYEPPSEPAIRRLLQLIDANAVDQAFSNWFRSLTGEGLAIAIDGKTLKGARQQDGSQIHLLSAFLQQKGIVIAQCEVESATNEIPVVKRLLSLNRGHWSIENSLHYVRDVAFHEDHSAIRTKNAPRVMASFKNLIIGIFRSLSCSAIKKTTRIMTYTPRFVLRLLRL